MRVVRVVFVLLVAASALEMADTRGLVAEDSAVASVAEAVRSLRTGEFDLVPLPDPAAPFRVAAEALD